MNDELKPAMHFDKVYCGLCEGKKYRRRSWESIESIERFYDEELNDWFFIITWKYKTYTTTLNRLYADDIFATDWEEVIDDMDS